MDSRTAAELYQKSSVENAPPLQILRLLYQGALRSLAQAAELDPVAQSPDYNDFLGRAEAIVAELRCSLDHDVAAELTGNLEALYEFCEAQIAQATIQKDTDAIAPARRVLETLLDAWMNVDVQQAPTRG